MRKMETIEIKCKNFEDWKKIIRSGKYTANILICDQSTQRLRHMRQRSRMKSTPKNFFKKEIKSNLKKNDLTLSCSPI